MAEEALDLGAVDRTAEKRWPSAIKRDANHVRRDGWMATGPPKQLLHLIAP